MKKDRARPESVIQKAMIQKLKDAGCFAFKAASPFNAGIPDVVACCKGRFVGVEVKRYVPGRDPRKDTTTLQLYVGDQIEDAGGMFVVTSDPDAAIEAIMKEINKGGNHE